MYAITPKPQKRRRIRHCYYNRIDITQSLKAWWNWQEIPHIYYRRTPHQYIPQGREKSEIGGGSYRRFWLMGGIRYHGGAGKCGGVANGDVWTFKSAWIIKCKSRESRPYILAWITILVAIQPKNARRYPPAGISPCQHPLKVFIRHKVSPSELFVGIESSLAELGGSSTRAVVVMNTFP